MKLCLKTQPPRFPLVTIKRLVEFEVKSLHVCVCVIYIENTAIRPLDSAELNMFPVSLSGPMVFKKIAILINPFMLSMDKKNLMMIETSGHFKCPL